ncbi:hypothetical protein [Methylocella sp.]|uniref:hypothetical protein n=1 Tax=Methylocella sp. TaxID=1978226 RepID=UPI0035B32C4D
MTNESEAPADRDEMERLKGRMLAIETAMGRLVWRCAREAAHPAEWVATYAAALERAKDAWRCDAPLPAAAMKGAFGALDEILHALEEGRLSLLPPAAGGPQPGTPPTHQKPSLAIDHPAIEVAGSDAGQIFLLVQNTVLRPIQIQLDRASAAALRDALQAALGA